MTRYIELIFKDGKWSIVETDYWNTPSADSEAPIFVLEHYRKDHSDWVDGNNTLHRLIRETALTDYFVV
jgi:hypothetical protein